MVSALVIFVTWAWKALWNIRHARVVGCMPTHALRINVIDILKRQIKFCLFCYVSRETFYLILYVVSCNTIPPLILTGRSFPYTSKPTLKSASVLFVFKNSL